MQRSGFVNVSHCAKKGCGAGGVQWKKEMQKATHAYQKTSFGRSEGT